MVAGATLVVTSVALVPAAAQAATRSVTMGEPASSVATFEQKYGGDANAFFPESLKVHVGDKVKFVPVGFHTVNFPAKGSDPEALIAPNGTISGVNDAMGSPFWFNGGPNLQFNPALFAGLYGKKVTFNPKKGLESGLPLAAKPKPVTVKFTKAGKFTYFCNVHPGMKATVTVVKKSKKIPSSKAVNAAVKKQVKRDVNVLKGLHTANVPAGTVRVGNAGPHGVDFYGMVPENLSVKVGDTVKFAMPTLSREVHTATFGPGNPETDPSSYLGQIASSFQGASLDQKGVYPSDNTLASLSPALHGNGFWNSGAMDNSATTPLPNSNSVKFGAPGTYDYYCMIHPFMHGVITVTG
jgi:plastocyanin